MSNFIISNSQIILVVLAFVLLILYKVNRREVMHKIILGLVVQAEKELGSGTGELKYAYVIYKLYNSLPSVLRLLYTRKEIDTYITEEVAKLKEILSKGINLNSYEDEIYIKAISKDNIK